MLCLFFKYFKIEIFSLNHLTNIGIFIIFFYLVIFFSILFILHLFELFIYQMNNNNINRLYDPNALLYNYKETLAP